MKNYRYKHKLYGKRSRRFKRIRFTCIIACVFAITGLWIVNTVKSKDDTYVNASQDTNNDVNTNDNQHSDVNNQNIEVNKPKVENVVQTPPDKQQAAITTTKEVKAKIDTKIAATKAVEDDYFDDAVFIGNSHTEGITAYSVMDNATVYAAKGIMVDTIFTKAVIKNSSGKRITIIDALSANKYGKVYILLGANELGWAYSSEFIKQYGILIDKIKDLQPNADIYVQSILPVTKKKSKEDAIYNNKNIKKFNALISDMAEEKEVYFLNISEAVVDKDGNLPDDVSKDGVHFGSKYYEKWFDYLKTHTVQ